MWKNYYKLAWRSLWKQKSFSLINILGLAIGLACFMLITLYVKDELSYDAWHEKGDRVYRFALERKYPGRSRHYATTPAGFADALKKEFSEVEEACRVFFFPGNSVIIKKGTDVIEETNLMWADSGFFKTFSIPLLLGDPATALTQPFSVVLTQSAAERYFGAADPIGRKLELVQNDNDWQVTGVCADVPHNSHLQFDMLISSASLQFIQAPNFINFSAYTYLLLHPNADPVGLEQKFPDMVVKYASGQVLNQFGVNYEEYQRQGNGYRYFLQALPDIYLRSNLESEIKPPGSLQRVRFFLLIAGLILVIACINFMNLATARSATRAREVGLRKTLGSARSQIASQFFMEAGMVTLVAAAMSWGMAYLALPYFNQLTGKAFGAEMLYSGAYLPLLLGATLVTGLLSGAYPAIALSAFRPIDVLRSKFLQSNKSAGLRDTLVVFQFGISVFLIISSILVFRQIEFTQNKNLGFDKNSLVSLQFAGAMTRQQQETFKNEIASIPSVEAVSGCSQMPGTMYFGISFRPAGAQETTTGSGIIVDNGYIECMKIEMLAGRSFSKAFNDTLSVVVNEAAVREMDMDDPVGKTLTSSDEFLNPDTTATAIYTIVGVVKDFHFQSLHHAVTPLFILHNQRSFSSGVDNLVTVRFGASDPQAIQAGLKQIEALWRKFQPELPFRHAFLDRDWANLYEKEMTTRKVFGLFSLIAIFIASLGLLALAIFMAERRTKEIGIRKVLGASVAGIVALLSKDFLKLVLLAIVIASPLAWYFMHRWLENFAYRIQIGWWAFALAGILSVAVAFLTVSFQSVKAALANPVDSLRSE